MLPNFLFCQLCLALWQKDMDDLEQERILNFLLGFEFSFPLLKPLCEFLGLSFPEYSKTDDAPVSWVDN